MWTVRIWNLGRQAAFRKLIFHDERNPGYLCRPHWGKKKRPISWLFSCLGLWELQYFTIVGWYPWVLFFLRVMLNSCELFYILWPSPLKTKSIFWNSYLGLRCSTSSWNGILQCTFPCWVVCHLHFKVLRCTIQILETFVANLVSMAWYELNWNSVPSKIDIKRVNSFLYMIL